MRHHRSDMPQVCHLQRYATWRRRTAGFAFVACVPISLNAQTEPTPSEPPEISEGVKRAAERPFYWIRIGSEFPASPRDPANEPKKLNPPSPAQSISWPTTPQEPGETRVESSTPPAASAIPPADSPSPNSPESSDASAAAEDASTANAPTHVDLPQKQDAIASPDGVSNIETSGSTEQQPEPDRPSGVPEATEQTSTVALKLLSSVEPEFPAALQRRLRQGSVEVVFQVMSDGSVRNTSVRSSSDSRLEALALAAVIQWRFEPIPAPRWGLVELDFR